MLQQTDTYFRVNRGRLKLREEGDRSELIFYDRDEAGSRRWSRYSKVPVTQPALLKEMLGESLGILAIVRKSRTLFLYSGARIHVDRVEGLGDFLEFEIPGDIGCDPEQLMAELRLKFRVEGVVTVAGSYCDLLLEKSQASGA